MTRKPYASDLSDQEWAMLEPLLPQHNGMPPGSRAKGSGQRPDVRCRQWHQMASTAA